MQINMLALDEGGNTIHHPVQVVAMCHPIMPGHHFAFAAFGKECLLLELTRGVTIGRGINRWAALMAAELHIFGMTAEDFSQKINEYEIINRPEQCGTSHSSPVSGYSTSLPKQ